MPNKGSDDIIIEYIQPQAMIMEAARILIRLFRFMACTIAYHLSMVITVSVNTDKCVAKTVRNPAT